MTRTSPLLTILLPAALKNAEIVSLRGHQSLLDGFKYKIELYSKERTISALAQLGETIAIKVQLNDHTQLIHAVINQMETGSNHNPPYYHYRIELVPWFNRLKRIKSSRIFQHQSVIDIFKLLTEEQQLVDYDLSRLSRGYEKKPYIVQYNETNYHFLMRLFQEAGICFHYQHAENHHLLYLIDERFSSANLHDVQKCESYYTTLRKPLWKNHTITTMTNDVTAKSGVIYRTFDREPFLAVTVEQEIKYSSRVTARLLSFSTNSDSFLASSSYYKKNLVGTTLVADFEPPIVYQKPEMIGFQLATVVGPKNKVVYCDSIGRVKVRFDWEQETAGLNDKTIHDDHCSCWLSVLQPLSGKNFGTQWIPRIGDQVLVAYENADPDRPIIVSSIYNEKCTEPFKLPANSSINGIKTALVDESAGTVLNVGHELIFDDQDKNPSMCLSSAGDLFMTINGEAHQEIGDDLVIETNRDFSYLVKQGSSSYAAESIRFNVGESTVLISKTGVQFTTPNMQIATAGAGQVAAIARVNDDHSCPKKTDEIDHKGGPILTGDSTMQISGQAVARKGDAAKCHVEQDTIAEGIESLTINNIPIAAVGLKTAHGGKIESGSSKVSAKSFNPLSTQTSDVEEKPKERFWVSIDYHGPDHLEKPCAEMKEKFLMRYQHNDSVICDTEKLDLFVTGSELLSSDVKMDAVGVENGEIITVNAKPISYPADEVPVTTADYQAVDAKDKKPKRPKPIREPRFGDKIVRLENLYPPMIINLREDAGNRQKTRLTDAEITHIKNFGNNITIFIHGFNVPEGAFARQVKEVKINNELKMMGVDASGRVVRQAYGIPSFNMTGDFCSVSTIYQGIDRLSKKFACLKQPLDMPAISDELLNGAGAYNWITHIENNLNLATGQFDWSDYRKFTRCVHVLWTGDVGMMNYLDAEDPADRAGIALIELIQQLHQSGIQINIIAHSLGNRVLLKMMDQGIARGAFSAETINHVFMCEAAVPNTALSNDPTKDTSRRRNSHFPRAIEVAKKVSVLYSQHDWTLWLAYRLANKASITSKEVSNYNRIAELERKLLMPGLMGLKHNSFDNEVQKMQQYKQEWDEEIKRHPQPDWQVAPALGYVGPDLHDDYIQHLLRDEKLIRVNTTPWIHGHSAMKNGTPEIIKKVYHDNIFKANGYKFGLY